MHTVEYTLNQERRALLDNCLLHLTVMLQPMFFSEEEKDALMQLVDKARKLLQKRSMLTFRYVLPRELLGNKAEKNVCYDLTPICSELFKQGDAENRSAFNVILLSIARCHPELCLPFKMQQQDSELIFPLNIKLPNNPFIYIFIGKIAPSTDQSYSTFQVQSARGCQIDDDSQFVCFCS